MQSVLDAVSTNVVVDKGLNLIQLAQQASSVTGGNISFTTLPITGFGTAANGEPINTVDLAQVRSTVEDLLEPKAAAAPASPAGTTPGTAPAPNMASPPPANPESSGTAGTTSANTYSDWTGSLEGGAIPASSSRSNGLRPRPLEPEACPVLSTLQLRSGILFP